MKISVNYKDGVLTLPGGIMEKIEEVNECELKLLIYICRECSLGKSEFMPEKASAELGISPSDIDSALAFLRGAGFIKLSGTGRKKVGGSEQKKEADEEKNNTIFTTPADDKKMSREVRIITNTPPQYSGKDLDVIVNSNDAVKRLKSEAESESMFGKPLHHSDLNKLVTLVDYFGFDEAYILQLLSISKDKSSPMNYAFRLGAEFYEKGINTYDTLLEELDKIEKANSFEGRMRKLFGIDKRTLSPKEKRFFEEWIGYDYSLVEYAYELTVDSTGKATMPYMNKILTSFTEKGIKSVEEAKAAGEKHREESKENKEKSSFDEKDFFAIALEGSYNKNEKKGDK